MLHLLIYSDYRNERVIVKTDDQAICDTIVKKLWRETDIDSYMGGSCVRLRNEQKTRTTIEWIVSQYGKSEPSLYKLMTPVRKLGRNEDFYIINEDRDTSNNIVYRKVAIACLEYERRGGRWYALNAR